MTAPTKKDITDYLEFCDTIEERDRQRDLERWAANEGRRRFSLYVAIGVAVALGCFALAFCSAARAHDHWINNGNYKNREGVHCCGVGDCQSLTEHDVKRVDGGWFIASLNETVSDADTLEGEDGFFWRCHRSDGSRRCFFRPMVGS